jgi:hypothetical protein
MDINLNTPATRTVATVGLRTSVYDFQTDTIMIAYELRDAEGNVITTMNDSLSREDTATFFSTPLAGLPDLRTGFVVAFQGYITSKYGAGQVVNTAPPNQPPAPDQPPPNP